MSNFKKIFISCCTFIFILMVPFSIYADSIYIGLPNSNTLTRDIISDNYATSTDIENLTDAQKNYIKNNLSSIKASNVIYINTYTGNLCYSSNNWGAEWTGTNTSTLYDVTFLDTDGNLSTGNFVRLYIINSNDPYIKFIKSSRIYEENGYTNMNAFDNSSLLDVLADFISNYTLTVNSNDTSLGSVSGSGNYPQNSEVTVYASAEVDARFVSWSDGSTENPYTFTLTSNTTLTAIFESTIVVPNLNLPTPNEPNYSVDVQQNQMISTNGSPGIRGGQIYSFNVDYYNIYSVVKTAETDEFFSNRNNNYYTYQLKDGKYIFPVYQYSELQVYAPNMNVSGAYIPIEIKYSELIPDYSYIILSDVSNVIQRDVSSFSTKYIDTITSDVYSFDKLPFSNSSNNENHLEYLGTAAEGGYTNFNASSVSIELSFDRGVNKTLYFVITDTTSSIENAQMMTNQATINNNMIQNFENVNNSIVSGTSKSQLVESSNNQSNLLLDNTISSYDQLEQSFKNDLDNNLGNLDLNFNFGSITDFTRTANFVRTQFDNITSDNPFGLLIGFSLAVGISLLIIGKRL